MLSESSLQADGGLNSRRFFLAVTKMDKVKLFDKIISVGLSKFPEIQIPIKNVSVQSPPSFSG